MILSKGTEVIPGWHVRFPIKQTAAADTYRVVDTKGQLGFFKLFHPQRIPEDRFDSDERLLEVVIMRSLDHPSIPTVEASGVVEPQGQPYLLTELVPGETLEDRLDRDFALTSAHASVVIRELLEAVTYLHGLQDPVFHNELTPQNVLLGIRDERDDRPTVIDFGHARRTSDGPAKHPSIVDPYYLPNEAYEGGRSSAATDVFALGAIYFRALYGMPPWDQGTDQVGRADIRELLVHARQKPPPMPVRSLGGDITPAVLTAIKKALSTRPDDRFPDAGSFLRALEDKPRSKQPASDAAAPQPLTPVRPARYGFAAVAGMEELKATLTGDVINAIREPDLYKRFGVTIANGILLYGPPGCGKTYIAKRLGEELGIPFHKIGPASVASIYIHGTQEKIGRLFDRAKAEAPCVLFLDEVDAMIPSRGGELHQGIASEVNEWLVQIDGCGEHDVFLVAATNQPRRLDPAVLRRGRFDKVVFVGPPDREARKAMFDIHLRRRPLSDEVNADELARMTLGWVGSDIKFVVDEAARTALMSGAEYISMVHLTEVIRRNQPSVGPSQVAEYEKMRREFEPERGARRKTRQIGF
ncbi:MAG: AAA family ATPase [Gammaproteobacteria bacterium]|nr:AAA family ATPase [Gammaproteobacteria bacterium]